MILVDAMLRCAEKKGIDSFDCFALSIPRKASKWLHYDNQIICKETEEVLFREKSSSCCYGDGPSDGSFYIHNIEEYITSEDKKEFRNYHGFSENSEFKPYVIDKVCPITGRLQRFNINDRWIIPAKVCAHCTVILLPKFVHRPLSDIDYKPQKDTWIKFVICSSCKVMLGWDKDNGIRQPVFYYTKDPKDPRAFLKKEVFNPKKSFFKKYISRHLTRVRKQRPISSKEVSFFRSWLGVKELAALAN